MEVGEASQRLVTLDDALFDGVVVGSVVDHVPGPIGDLAGGLRGRVLPESVDHLQLESLQLIGRLAGREPRERLADRLFPHRGRHQKPVAQRDLVHQEAPMLSGCATRRGHFSTSACYGRLVQDNTSAAGDSDDDRDEADSSGGGTSKEQGYEGAGVEEGGGYQRSAEGGGGYEESGTEEEGYDPRREAESEG